MAFTPVRGPLNFTAADDTTIETLYSYFALLQGTSAGYLGVKSNRLTHLFGDTGVRYLYRDDSGTYAANQYSRAKMGGWGSLFYYAGLATRVSADTGSGADAYLLRIQDVAGSGVNKTTEIIKLVNGSPTTLDTRNVAWADSDDIIFSAVDSGANVDLAVYRNSTASALYTVTDSTSVLASGKPGFMSQQNSGNALWWDDMELGEVTSGGGGGGSKVPLKLQLLMGA